MDFIQTGASADCSRMVKHGYQLVLAMFLQLCVMSTQAEQPGADIDSAVAEVGANDLYQRAEIGYSLVGNDRRMMNSMMDKVIDKAEDLGLAEIIDTDIEIISF